MSARTGIAAELLEHGPAVLEHINGSHDDALLLIARFLGDRPGASAAHATEIDVDGLQLLVADGDEVSHLRIAFSEPIVQMIDVQPRAMALVALARERSGEAGETSIEREARLRSAIRTFVTSVSAVEDVHPHLRRITFAGGDLSTFAPLGPDTFIYVLLPPPGRTELSIDASFSWDQYREMPEADRPVGAYYTLHTWDPATTELSMLFVLHEPSGHASAWAAQAAVGDPVALWGPREAFLPPEDTGAYLLVADDTGLPAVASIIAALPTHVTATVIAEVDGPAEQQSLPQRPGVTVHWVHRNGAAPGSVAHLLVDELRTIASDDLGDRVYAWGGGESRAMTAVRRHLRQERGWSRDRVAMIAYWRHADSPIDAEGDE